MRTYFGLVISFLSCFHLCSGYTARRIRQPNQCKPFVRTNSAVALRLSPGRYVPSESPCELGIDERVVDIYNWIRLSDESLRKLSTDGKGGLYDRINEALSQSDHPAVRSAEDVDESTRFAVLSHGNQPDPVYNYINTAGHEIFRWPKEIYYRLPSRYSAPDGALRNNRAQQIAATVVDDVTYIPEAVRVRYPNKTVIIREAVLWNVYDDAGYRVGQTVLFDTNLASYEDDNQ